MVPFLVVKLHIKIRIKLFPQHIDVIVTIKGKLELKEGVSDDTDAPNVRLVRVRPLLNDFWRAIIDIAYLQVPAQVLPFRREAEVCELDPQFTVC